MFKWRVLVAAAKRLLPVVSYVVVASAAALVTHKAWQARAERIESQHIGAILSIRLAAEEKTRLAVEQARRAEHIKIQALEEERETHIKALEVMGDALLESRDQSSRLRDTIAAERRRATEVASTTGGDRSAAAAPWVVLDACRREYEQMAADADRLNERARLAAGYARAVNAE